MLSTSPDPSASVGSAIALSPPSRASASISVETQASAEGGAVCHTIVSASPKSGDRENFVVNLSPVELPSPASLEALGFESPAASSSSSSPVASNQTMHSSSATEKESLSVNQPVADMYGSVGDMNENEELSHSFLNQSIMKPAEEHRTASSHPVPVGVLTEASILEQVEEILTKHPTISTHTISFQHAAKLVAILEEESLREEEQHHTSKHRKSDSAHHIDTIGLHETQISAASAANLNNAVYKRVLQENCFDTLEIAALSNEIHHPWRQPKLLYFLCFVNAMAAIVQGMDETVVNGAQIFYFDQLNLHDPWLQGLVNAAPYLACAVISVWLTGPLNDYLGRRGTIFAMCIIAAAASAWEGGCDTWLNLFFARFVLGVSIGAKSTTVPVYASECAPTPIRGALTSLWQMFTAFGIFLGYLVDVSLVSLPSSVSWRWMLASTAIAPIIVCIFVYVPPESPRWLMKQGRYPEAFQSLLKLRGHSTIAARDFLLLHFVVQEVSAQPEAKFKDLFSTMRNTRAVQAAFLLMLLQQFCGVNVIMYYSAQIFVNAAGVSQTTAIYSSLGAGIINFAFAVPATLLIDRWGRRKLLLTTFPLMSLFLFFTAAGFAFSNSDAKLGFVATGIYIYMAVYSFGAGPVPFTYAAEAFPLEIRELGMASAVAVTWFFSFLLSMLWPSMLEAFHSVAAFSFYATCCILGGIGIYFIVPETKGVSLEELDEVFQESLGRFAHRKWTALGARIQRLLSAQRAEISKQETTTARNSFDEKSKSCSTNDKEDVAMDRNGIDDDLADEKVVSRSG